MLTCLSLKSFLLKISQFLNLPHGVEDEPTTRARGVKVPSGGARMVVHIFQSKRIFFGMAKLFYNSVTKVGLWRTDDCYLACSSSGVAESRLPTSIAITLSPQVYFACINSLMRSRLSVLEMAV